MSADAEVYGPVASWAASQGDRPKSTVIRRQRIAESIVFANWGGQVTPGNAPTRSPYSFGAGDAYIFDSAPAWIPLRDSYCNCVCVLPARAESGDSLGSVFFVRLAVDENQVRNQSYAQTDILIPVTSDGFVSNQQIVPLFCLIYGVTLHIPSTVNPTSAAASVIFS